MMYFSDGGHTYMKRQMWQIAAELLPRVAIGARDNAITLQESRPQAFIAFFIAVQGYLRSSSGPPNYPARTM